GEAPAGGDRHGSQGRSSGDIAYRVDSGNIGVLKFIGDDEVTGVELYAGTLQVERGYVGGTPDSPKQYIVCLEFAAVRRRQGLQSRFFDYGFRHEMFVNGHSLGAHLTHQGFTEHHVE